MTDEERSEIAQSDTHADSDQGSNRFRDACFAFNLRRASRIVTRRYEKKLRSLQMTAFQFTALAALDDRGPLPQSALAHFFGMDVSTLSRNLAAMERKGWLAYVPDPYDGRVRNVGLTKKGQEVFATAIPIWEEAQAETHALLKKLSWDDVSDWLKDVSRDPQG